MISRFGMLPEAFLKGGCPTSQDLIQAEGWLKGFAKARADQDSPISDHTKMLFAALQLLIEQELERRGLEPDVWQDLDRSF